MFWEKENKQNGKMPVERGEREGVFDQKNKISPSVRLCFD